MSHAFPFISIVIPSYNRAAFLRENIPPLLQLDYNAYEVIVVNDGSTDDTSRILADLQNPKLSIYTTKNEERGAARNFGALHARGDYITFLDSDDILYPDALQKAAQVIEEKQAPAVLHFAYHVGTRQLVSKTVNNIAENPLILVKGNPFSCIGTFIKKEVFAKHQFNTDREIAGCEDWEYWVRLAANYGITTSNEVVGRLIEHEDRSVLNATEEQLLRRKLLSHTYVFQDAAVNKVYGPYRKTMTAYSQSYISLHLAIDGKKIKAIRHLLESLRYDLSSVYSRRTLAIFKLLLLYKVKASGSINGTLFGDGNTANDLHRNVRRN